MTLPDPAADPAPAVAFVAALPDGPLLAAFRAAALSYPPGPWRAAVLAALARREAEIARHWAARGAR